MTRTLLLTGRFLIEDSNGHQTTIRFEDCTPEQEAEYRRLALETRQPRNTRKATKRNAHAGKFMHKGYSPADQIVAGDILNINENKVI